MELLIYRGNNKFSMYEDDGETMNFENGEFAFTDYEIKENGNSLEFSVSPARGYTKVLPVSRNYKLSFKDIVSADVTVYINRGFTEPEIVKNDTLCVLLKGVKPTDTVKVELKNVKVKDNGNRVENLIELISKFQCRNKDKARKFDSFIKDNKALPPLPNYYKEPIEEIEMLHDF